MRMAPTNDTRFVRLPEILDRTRLGKTTIYALIKKRRFPAPRHIGRLSVWNEKEFREWLNEEDRKQTIAELV